MRRGNDTPVPAAAPSSAPDEPDSLGSGLLTIVRDSVLVFAAPGPDLAAVHAVLLDLGLVPVTAEDAAIAFPVCRVRAAIVEVARSGALEMIARLAAPPHEVHVLAVADGRTPDSEDAAVVAGAAATARRPFSAPVVRAHLQRFLRCEEVRARARQLFHRDQESALALLASQAGAAMAHELRNPLTAAIADVSVLLDSTRIDGVPLSHQERSDVYVDVWKSLVRMKAILADVAALARGEQPSVEPVSLVEVVKAALASVPRAARVELRFESEREVVGLGSRSMLEQVVVNLVKNALDAVGGTAQPRVLVRVYQTGAEARISVRDNGPGVPSHMQTNIFEPFVSTKGAGGTGLGLAISRQAVAAMGGALTLSPTGGVGACFRIRLRRATQGSGTSSLP